MALPEFTMRRLLEVGRAFRPSVASLEPENGALHLRGPQQDPHHRSRPDGAIAASGVEGRLRHRGEGRPGAVRRHQAPGGQDDRRCRQKIGPILHQFALARRHADQLEDDFRLDPASAQGGRHARRRRRGPDQERAPDDVARARQAREGARRHQGHGRHPGSHFRHRHQQGATGDQGGPAAADSGRSRSSTPIAIRTASLIPIPGNDDAGRAIALYCDLVASAAIDGISRGQGSAGRRPRRRRRERRLAEALPPRRVDGRERRRPSSFELLAAPRGAPDDLAKLPGIGPQIVKKLNEHGVFHYLAARRDDPGRGRQDRP